MWVCRSSTLNIAEEAERTPRPNHLVGPILRLRRLKRPSSFTTPRATTTLPHLWVHIPNHAKAYSSEYPLTCQRRYRLTLRTSPLIIRHTFTPHFPISDILHALFHMRIQGCLFILILRPEAKEYRYSSQPLVGWGFGCTIGLNKEPPSRAALHVFEPLKTSSYVSHCWSYQSVCVADDFPSHPNS